MIFKKIEINGPQLINLKRIEDKRGFFARQWCFKEFSENGIEFNIKQVNTSLSNNKGTLRGLHFQYPPKSESKIIRCISGIIWDVIVDIRKNSNTYGKWYGVELSEVNKSMLYIPKGFAHGFISLSDYAEIIYLVSEEYSPKYEDTLIWSDNKINIKWPIEPKHISDKDSKGKNLEDLQQITL